MAWPFGCRELAAAELDLIAHLRRLARTADVQELIAVSAASRLLCKLPPKLPRFSTQGTWSSNGVAVGAG